jgi:predicted GIY-YIG superfamily endonuclease
MKDAHDRVLYVGKAKDLKQRLNHYRLANPDRMPRRHLRMVREVTRIEFQFCTNEAAALRHESRLLRSLRPRFNRAGVWPGKTRFLVWRAVEAKLELSVVEVPGPDWCRYGPMNSSACVLHQACCRLLWLAVNPQASITELPAGWRLERLPDAVALHCGNELDAVLAGLRGFFWDHPASFVAWLGSRLSQRKHSFERAVIAADLEALQNFVRQREQRAPAGGQLALL